MNDDWSERLERLARTRNFDAALALARQWTGAEPENADAWNGLAYICQLRGDLDQAQSAIAAAVKINPGHPGLLFESGVIEYRLKHYELAAESFDACVHVCMESDDAYYRDAARIACGQSYFAARDYQHAADAIDGVNPDSATWLEGRLTAARLASAIAEQLSNTPAARMRV